MACQICGDEKNVEYRNRSRMALCGSCHKDTPVKATREEFDTIYWVGCDDVPESTKREFFADYKASKHSSVETYRDRTTSYS
jgi:hypothetical protein